MNRVLSKTGLLAAMGICIVLLAVACRPTVEPSVGGAVITGEVTYPGAAVLAPGAALEVELRDVSLLDVASVLIARQVIVDPGQGPAPFRIDYDPGDIQRGNTYAVSARILRADGSLAFINDTAYPVSPSGGSDRVDLALVAVEPSATTVATPASPAEPTAIPAGDRVEVPVSIVGVAVAPPDPFAPDYLLTVSFMQYPGAACSAVAEHEVELRGNQVRLRVTSWEQAGALSSCPPEPGKLDAPIDAALAPGQSYQVRTNGELTNTFSVPPTDFPESRIVLSPIDAVEIVTLEIYPPRFVADVTSGLPNGCARFNGYRIERPGGGRVNIFVTHHQAASPGIACAEIYRTVESSIPLGADFVSGREYAIVVNSDVAATFVAQ